MTYITLRSSFMMRDEDEKVWFIGSDLCCCTAELLLWCLHLSFSSFSSKHKTYLFPQIMYTAKDYLFQNYLNFNFVDFFFVFIALFPLFFFFVVFFFCLFVF